MRIRALRIAWQKGLDFAYPAIFVTAFLATAPGCTVYQPVPVSAPAPSTFDRSWSAAIGAAQDEGVRITSENRVNGVITGSRGEQDVTINVFTQADGRVRVEFSARGPKGSEPGLASRISQAYDRRMGR
ncbi:MAG TPA: hypothetical protein VI585_14605 [Candidatus Binatia bacterium]